MPPNPPFNRREVLRALAACAIPELGNHVLHRLAAARYGFRRSDRTEFRDSWDLFVRILPEDLRRNHHRGQDAVERSLRDLAVLVRSWPTPGGRWQGLFNLPPHGALPRVATRSDRKLVVFSDHHLAQRAHRHNVFSGAGGKLFRSSNHQLYTEVLRSYLDAGYTVVENGDVEECVVFDPALYPGEYQRRLAATEDADGRLAALVDARERLRREQVLPSILADPVNRDYYAVLAELAEKDQLVRTAGNHDYMVRHAWAEAIERTGLPAETFPPEDVFCDALMVGNGSSLVAVVLHGHAFDSASHPEVASRYGETISECMGVWYQGADRIWPWDEHGHAWANGLPFRNQLVAASLASRAELEAAQRLPYAAPTRATTRMRAASGALGAYGFWEEAFQHPIAWEYLADYPRDADDMDAAAFRAALTGEAWFKFRHTEEIALARVLPEELAAAGHPVPIVVLGHTHEPRGAAIDPFGSPASWYYNAGAAGRFEGLVWGVEIADGEAQVVSWHADPHPVGIPTRRIWRPGGAHRELLVSSARELG